MKNIVFIDTEVSIKTKKILDIGAVKADGDTFHANNISKFTDFLSRADFICGHNILEHDLMFLYKKIDFSKFCYLDTLFWSPLLFPTRPYHSLLKDDKLQTDELNNPVNDAKKARDLLADEVARFQSLDQALKQIFYFLLHKEKRFNGLFRYLDYLPDVSSIDILDVIKQCFQAKLCHNANLEKIIKDNPIELSYSLALIDAQDRYSITPPWVLKRFPEVHRIMYLLRNNPCLTGCAYCNQNLDIHRGLKKYFGFNSFRTYNHEPLQEKAAQAAIKHKSLLSIFPTGGGKSLTFQLPALMQGESAKGLTVVISPLQSLMKDQVDNLEQIGITDAVTINGLLDPIERAKSFERVQSGKASLLYISPESLRSRTIEHLLLGRNIVRFVIDEAHCFSAWGQDFRVDYLYIGDFISSLKAKKNLTEDIPVSCFTATAKQNVIADIKNYFKEKLDLELETFRTKSTRKNLRFKVYPKGDEEGKYNMLRNLIDAHNCPTIIYASRTKKVFQLATRLTQDGYAAKPYHGKMDKQEKTNNQDAFIGGEVQIMVATSAFGMGVDKKDVGMVIHYEISDSLENYIQEAGRAGRDEDIEAECYVLFDEEDLSKHFILLNQTKLNIKEIQQVWQAVKWLTRSRSKMSNSALEIARKAGWNDSVAEIETRVKTAIAALEESGYLKRGQNIPRIFANSILAKNVQEAIDKINQSDKFNNEKQKQNAVRIIKRLFSSKNCKNTADEEVEARIDYISDHLGIVKEDVIEVINLLREEKILADTKDLTAFIKSGSDRQSRKIIDFFFALEEKLLAEITGEAVSFNIKQLNQNMIDQGVANCSLKKIKTIFNFWAIKNWIKQSRNNNHHNHLDITLQKNKNELIQKFRKRQDLAAFIIDYLFEKINNNSNDYNQEKEHILVEFSVYELKNAYLNNFLLSSYQIDNQDIEDTLFYLSRIEALKIEGGFLVIYNKLTIERIEKDNKKRYKAEDYKKLKQFYENKVQQIHIVGEYAKKMISDDRDALQLVEDYFQLNYTSFLEKYFKGDRKNEIKRNITPKKFRQLFGELSRTQLNIIKDKDSQYIAVAAGPGSGKTRILVHKLASLLLMEDVKHEQLLMLTFSRAAATEFKKRLLKLIGNAANFIEIKTFHSYCFDVLGRVGDLEKSDKIIQNTIEKIKLGEVEPNKIAKSVLVIDEAQDMDANEYQLISLLMEYNQEMRIIAVGDDDQNIYEFRGSSSKYLENFITQKAAKKYELLENYRSKKNLVEFTNQFVLKLKNRIKNNPIVPIQQANGSIKIVQHQSNQLIRPLVNDVVNFGLSGSTCILTKTNHEALQITGLLINNGFPAKLIQTNDGFSLYNLYEIRYFIENLKLRDDVYVISDEQWNEAKHRLIKKFANSSKLELCVGILKNFELSNPKTKYKSDFAVFLRESKIEDFYSSSVDTIMVSTIHKAKGKEFDNIFILLDQFKLTYESKKRVLYVAMTRAKNNLVIHLNNNILNGLRAENLELKIDSKQYGKSEIIILRATHRDVWLGSFVSEPKQTLINKLQSGDSLLYINDTVCNLEKKALFKFSKSFMTEIKVLKNKGYKIKEIKVNSMVFWRQEETNREVVILLPEIYFEINL